MVEAGEAEVLDAVGAMRKRPGMYIGDVRDGSGLRHMLWEAVANALDEHLAGHARRLDVRLDGARATVEDDGRGIPIAEMPDGRTYLETVLTQLHRGGTEDGHFPHVHIADGLGGLGLAPVCALSESLTVEVKREFVQYTQQYIRGRPVAPLVNRGPCGATGTSISFVPDSEIFANRDFDNALIVQRLQELAFLNPDLKISFQREPLPGGDGLGDYCKRLAEGPLLVRDPLRLRGRFKGVDVDVAIAWRGVGRVAIRSYVSQYETRDGGAHERGFWEGLRRAFHDVDAKGYLAKLPTDRFRRAVGEGLVAVVHAGLYDPQFDAPTRSRLKSPEARSAVAHVVRGGLAVYLAQYPSLREALFSRLIDD
jgi:DNA gyrase subunit B